jgi:pSer/pThr/pTyr-binding forkhead associated (FHA) protein
MIELVGLTDPVRGRRYTIRRLPAFLGRNPDSDVALEAPGVWDRHLRFDWDRAQGILVSSLGAAGLWVNDQPVREARLRNGDILTVGGVRLRFQLSPTSVRPRLVSSAVAWLVVFGVMALELWLMGRAGG